VKNLRKYGKEPFQVAVLHGGPGSPGEMAPVAREFSRDTGVLEPLQTKSTIEGQVEELKGVLEKNSNLPLTLIGFSWGAWLGFIFTAHYHQFIDKLILIGSGPFEEKHAADIMETRLGRLGENEKNEALFLLSKLNSNTADDKILARFGELMSRADSYDPLPHDAPSFVSADVYRSVWREANNLRQSGELLQLGRKIRCPVVAIHGDYDPHPAEGVREPLSRVIKDFRFILLEKCGHRPWLERNAKDSFYLVLRNEISIRS